MSTPDGGRGGPLQRLPLPAVFVIIATIWIGGRLVFRTGVQDAFTIALDVAFGFVIAGAVTARIGYQRRRLGSADATVVYARAVRTGQVPDGVDTADWPQELDRSTARVRRSRWIVRVGGLLPFGLGLWGLTEADSRILGAVLVVLMIAGWIFTEIQTPRALARIEGVRSAIAS